jgi:hypothetical protein
MLISVHFPKTAGTSFLASLEHHFGERLLQDYTDRPINSGAARRNIRALQSCLRNALPRPDLAEVACVHGHFMPLKYTLLRAVPRKNYVAWMRDPVERVASHYSYWTRDFDPRIAGQLHRRVVEERWSLERFCLGPEMRNLYSKFLWGFSLSHFDFIGITEFYEAELEQFSHRILGVPVPRQLKNVNPNGERHAHIGNPELRRKIEDYHAADMKLYRRAVQSREQRLASAGQG